MLKDLRTSAGLRSPLKIMFTTNGCESLNAVIKRKVKVCASPTLQSSQGHSSHPSIASYSDTRSESLPTGIGSSNLPQHLSQYHSQLVLQLQW